MNAERRKQIEEAMHILESVRDAEQEAYDNLPESFQSGEQGDAMQSAIDSLERAISHLELEVMA
jgi:hypothetical protein